MVASSDLFQLIKSLSKTEKRHFVLYSTKHVIGEQNGYMKLFYAIEKQKEYDEGKIKKQFVNDSFIKRFPRCYCQKC